MHQPGTIPPAAPKPATQPSAAAPLLSVRNLSVEIPHRRGGVTALHDVSFDAAKGEILGVVGESGAGKSLTGQAIIGLLEPPLRIIGGQILFDGQDLCTFDRARMRGMRGKEIGAIFQDPLTSLNPLFTIGEMLMETLTTHLPLSAAQARERALAMLAEVGIPSPEERFGHYPHQFSGGMRQRVVIALALCTNPRLVIADEPTTALDVSVQAQIISLLKRLSREHGTTVILITHDMGVIAETAHRVCVMYAGRVVEIGPVRDLVSAPQHPYSQGLLQSIPRMGNSLERLPQIEGTMPRPGASPPGCAFHPRCPHAKDICARTRPATVHDAAGLIECHLHPGLDATRH